MIFLYISTVLFPHRTTIAATMPMVVLFSNCGTKKNIRTESQSVNLENPLHYIEKEEEEEEEK